MCYTKSMQWFEKEDFWIQYGPIMFDQQRWAESTDVAEKVCSIAKLKPGSKILDAGCGPGRITTELALLNMDVTGIDIIQPFLDAAKESADDEGVSVNLVNADLRNFCPQSADSKNDYFEKFDLAVNLYTSFGYCDTIEEDTLILKNIFNSIKKGGTFILEMTSRESAIKYFTEGEWFRRAGKIVFTEFSVQGAWEGLVSKWTLIDETTGEKTEHCFVQRLYSAVELCRTLKEIGFTSIEVEGGFDGEKYDQNLKTLVIIARK